MGIFKATVSAMRSTASDQWKEAFVSGEMGSEVLFQRAKRMTREHSSNKGNGDIITSGSVIIVGEGECAVATESGKIISIYDEPGEHIFESNKSKGIFGGSFGSFMKDVGRRISFGGDVSVSQRLYYINTKELTGGTICAECIPLRYKDSAAGLDIDGGISCHGSYTFRIVDPELFYKAAIRSVKGRYRKELLEQMDSEVLTALQPAISKLAEEGVRPCELMHHTDALCEKLSIVMSDKWSGLRGIAVFSLGLDSVRVLDAAMVRTLQRDAAFKDPVRAAAHITGAAVDAIQAAAQNKSGGSAFAVGVSGVNTAAWKCQCGHCNEGKFCTECGTKKPAG